MRYVIRDEEIVVVTFPSEQFNHGETFKVGESVYSPYYPGQLKNFPGEKRKDNTAVAM